MSLSLFKVCSCFVLGGSAIAVPTYFFTKLSGTSSTSKVENKQVTSSSRPSSRAPDAKTQRFNDCLDGNLKFKATNKNDHRTEIISVGEVPKYREEDG